MTRTRITIHDTNIALDHALQLGRLGHEVFYYTHCDRSYPKLKDLISGYGFPEITKIDEFATGVKQSDLVIFVDVGFGADADYLRSLDHRVIGSDARTEKLELDRIKARKVLSGYGIKFPKFDVVKGLHNAMKVVDQKGERVVKINVFRGDMETFIAKDAEELYLNITQTGLNVLAEQVDFILEEVETGLEIGVDTFFNGRDFADYVNETIEVRGEGNIGKFVKYERSIWKETLDALRDYLTNNGYQGIFCLEGFLTLNGDIHITDITPRFPFPGSFGFPRAISNWVQVLYDMADSKPVKIVPNSLYNIQIPIYTTYNNQFFKVFFGKKVERNIAFRYGIKKGDDYVYVPIDDTICVMCAENNTIDFLISDIKEIDENISAKGAYHEFYAFIETLKHRLRKAKEYGYDF
jgi:hypothetical protein